MFITFASEWGQLACVDFDGTELRQLVALAAEALGVEGEALSLRCGGQLLREDGDLERLVDSCTVDAVRSRLATAREMLAQHPDASALSTAWCYSSEHAVFLSALSIGAVDVVEFLADVAGSVDRSAAFRAASVRRNWESLFALRRLGFDLAHPAADGSTALHHALARRAPVAVVARLLNEDGCDPNLPRHDGVTPLCLATGLAQLRCLLEAGADLEHAGPVLCCSLRHVDFLCDLGVGLNTPDDRGHTPYELALRRGNAHAARRLFFAVRVWEVGEECLLVAAVVTAALTSLTAAENVGFVAARWGGHARQWVYGGLLLSVGALLQREGMTWALAGWLEDAYNAALFGLAVAVAEAKMAVVSPIAGIVSLVPLGLFAKSAAKVDNRRDTALRTTLVIPLWVLLKHLRSGKLLQTLPSVQGHVFVIETALTLSFFTRVLEFYNKPLPALLLGLAAPVLDSMLSFQVLRILPPMSVVPLVSEHMHRFAKRIGCNKAAILLPLVAAGVAVSDSWPLRASFLLGGAILAVR